MIYGEEDVALFCGLTSGEPSAGSCCHVSARRKQSCDAFPGGETAARPKEPRRVSELGAEGAETLLTRCASLLEFEVAGIQHPRERGRIYRATLSVKRSPQRGVVALNNERAPLFVYSGGTQRAAGRPLPPSMASCGAVDHSHYSGGGN